MAISMLSLLNFCISSKLLIIFLPFSGEPEATDEPDWLTGARIALPTGNLIMHCTIEVKVFLHRKNNLSEKYRTTRHGQVRHHT
ncbi:hypothetical protein [Roseibium aggregatum]|uniref:Uncharacterized protein n=1 Tax=Roseibium aggregatum TaxID=187304 RepID=A0A939EDR8_9HYPH|nr:hypothetical protein [Roseibium aggregatum]MBN9670881.1 hypothetical protein [Roseibium aggregatum]